MKPLISLLMATLILGSSMLPVFSLEQSAKWNEVIQHFERHRLESPGLGLLDFVALHYGASNEHRKHPNHSHQNLPTLGQSAPVMSPPTPFQIPDPPLLSLSFTARNVFFPKTDLYSFLSVSDLINPPRRA